MAFLCILNMGDEIALEDSAAKYNALDPNIEGSAEGDFMGECVLAVQHKSGDEYIGSYSKLSAMINLRGNLVAKTLLAAAQGQFAAEEPEKEVEDKAVNAKGGNAKGGNDDDDLL
jgi:hypothetical protein